MALMFAVLSDIGVVQGSRPLAPPSFQAHGTWGPALPIPETPVDGRAVCAREVYGPVWDGVNNGLWVVLRDWTAGETGGSKCAALLIDPATGKEKRRLTVPSHYLLGHDGVGLWLAVEDGKDSGSRSVRVRTAPDLTSAQKAHGLNLPEDLPASIPTAGFDVILTAVLEPHVFRLSRTEPVSVFALPWAVRANPDRTDPGRNAASLPWAASLNTRTSACHLGLWYFDTRTLNIYAPTLPLCPLALGGGYVWSLDSGLERLELSRLSPLASLRQDHEMPWSRNSADDAVIRQANGQLAWDGERLWSSHATTLEPGARRPDRVLPPIGASDRKETVIVPPVRLVSIDVGFARKPDTTARYNKALAFERKNGTLKAIPLFEELIASDPAAVEIRNHLGWALGTRPQEPYHDLLRARQLVESAIEWQPWDPEKWDTLAEIYWRLGDAKLAERLEAKAINLNPTKAFYWKQLDKFRTQPGSDDAPEPAY
jgi:tetratricopeptide (TPR) repeat protein